ncbi:hypothetical protein BSL78_09793 [Apostichopus japonicus]|uniref:Uncharacterized protein n=1 Tax=Stichopus japonicus TaxID=307972 RepID=A0A2G8KZ67_STIJA|nr:hypothetical protein BSL78_09793 [Apostichopus japonicus]
MTLADGISRLQCEGCAMFEVKIDEHVVEHTVWVAEIGADAFLGLSFMRKHNYHLNVMKGTLSWVGLNKSNDDGATSEISCCRVLVDETVVIAPESEAMILGRISEGVQHWESALVEPAEKFIEKHKLLVAKSLVDPRNSKIPVRVFNPTSEVIKVYEGTVAATLEEASVLNVPSKNAPSRKQMVSMVTSISDNRKEVPEHVVDLLEIGTEHLADEQRADLVNY